MVFKTQHATVLATAFLIITIPTTALATQPSMFPTIQQEGQGTYENMIAALDNLGAEVEQLNALTELGIGNVRIFDADYLASAHDPAALDQAKASHGEQIQYAQNTLANHEVVRTVLEMVNIPVESVLAVDTLAAGDVAIYYQP
jgi:hypothetical protein